jgi:signal transduction histidine kinase
VTLLDPSGREIGDSEVDGPAPARPRNQAPRPEVAAAARRGTGWAIRTNPATGDEELYVAVRAPLGMTRVSTSTRELNDIVWREQRDVLASGLLALFVTSGIALAFSRLMSRPIVELRDVAQALATGDLSRRPSLTATGEVGDLAAAVHRMAEQLDSRLQALEADEVLLQATLESLNEGVIVVNPRRQVIRVNAVGRRLLALRDPLPFPADRLPRDRGLREALADALGGRPAGPVEIHRAGSEGSPPIVALQARPLHSGGAVLALLDLTATRRLEAVRRDFVANVSHELRTPLAVIGGFAETLQSNDLAPEERHRFAVTIASHTQRMQRIVDDLLDLSRIESGGWVPNPTHIAAATTAADAIAPCRASAERKVVTLHVEVPPGTNIYADPTALRQVLANLVENAVRYTPPGGTITLFAYPEDGGVWIGVRDTGIGIAAAHLPRIFERFYRADPARSREAGGTGLGLSIVRHLVEAHRGRVHADSTPGRGTTVLAFFPGPPAST